MPDGDHRISLTRAESRLQRWSPIIPVPSRVYEAPIRSEAPNEPKAISSQLCPTIGFSYLGKLEVVQKLSFFSSVQAAVEERHISSILGP